MSPDLALGLHGPLLQAIGVLPFTILGFLLTRSIGRDYLRYWWPGWASLAIALFALYASLRFPRHAAWLEPVYYLGEYVFGGLLVAGCRNLARGTRLRRTDFLFLVPALALALVLPHVHGEFSVRFIPQAAIMAVLFGLALRETRAAPFAREWRIGMGLLQISLLALTVSFAHYVPVLSWAAWEGRELASAYSSAMALFDLLFETLLGFATLGVTMEREHRELEQANEELRAARARLEALARLDPLTSSLNRHAFYSMVEGSRSDEGAAGCVAIADIDDLKPVNDGFGHAAGDAAIRAVARAIRQVVRADDLVFRWGGDEFLVVLFRLSEEQARERLDSLERLLAEVAVPGSPAAIALTVSVGFAPFGSLRDLEHAIERADDQMYRKKHARRRAGARGR